MSKVVRRVPKAKKPRKQSVRKGPMDWRAINRAHRVKDGRSVLLCVPHPRRAGELQVIEGWWCKTTKAWWPANCSAGLPGCEPIADTYGEPLRWCPMPPPPVLEMAA